MPLIIDKNGSLFSHVTATRNSVSLVKDRLLFLKTTICRVEENGENDQFSSHDLHVRTMLVHEMAFLSLSCTHARWASHKRANVTQCAKVCVRTKKRVNACILCRGGRFFTLKMIFRCPSAHLVITGSACGCSSLYLFSKQISGEKGKYWIFTKEDFYRMKPLWPNFPNFWFGAKLYSIDDALSRFFAFQKLANHFHYKNRKRRPSFKALLSIFEKIYLQKLPRLMCQKKSLKKWKLEPPLCFMMIFLSARL